MRAGAPPAAHPIRVRAWQELCGPETNSTGICVHVVAANLIPDSPVTASLRLLPAQFLLGAAALPQNASRLFGGGGYTVDVGPDGVFADTIAAGDTAVYGHSLRNDMAAIRRLVGVCPMLQ